MIRRGFTIASALSLLLCAIAVWLLARHGRVVGVRHEIFSVYLKSRHARYTLRGDADRLALCAPPPAAPMRMILFQRLPGVQYDPRPPEVLLTLMRNEDIVWHVQQFENQEQLHVEAGWIIASFARYNRLGDTDAGLLIPGLLEALDDPRRAVAAHVTLVGLSEVLVSFPEIANTALPRKPTGPFAFAYDSMKVECPSLGRSGSGFSDPNMLADYEPPWHVDPSQFPALRAQWHARLDRPVAAVPYSRAAVATAMLPAIWLAAWLRRRVVSRRPQRGNLCRSCGYDLRASAERCPECGTQVPAKREA